MRNGSNWVVEVLMLPHGPLLQPTWPRSTVCLCSNTTKSIPAASLALTFPRFLALKCSRKIINKTISMISVSLGGQNVGNIVRDTSPTPPATDPAASFNNGVPELSGGIINLVLTSQAQLNLKNSVGVANRSPQFIGVNVTVTFTDGTSSSDILHFGTNNNAFRAPVPDLRGSFGTSATPAVGDRFFFTDENQTGDPVRYVQMRDLASAMGVGKLNPVRVFSGNVDCIKSQRVCRCGISSGPQMLAGFLAVQINPGGSALGSQWKT